jgi:diacylglycerol kinase (ATP)
MLRPKNSIDSVHYALNGILHAFRSQRHLRFHFFIASLVLLAGVVWKLPRVELLVLFASITFVIMTELINTAVEAVVDLVTTAYHPLAKLAKDIAAGAVLVAGFNAVVVGAVLFLNPDRIQAVLVDRRPVAEHRELEFLVIVCVILLAILLFWKVLGGRGTFLHGGVVSGHSAVGFCLGTVIVLSAPNEPFIWLVALLLALLTAQSRVEAGVHSVREVVLGALLGICIPLLILYVLPLLAHRLAGPPAVVVRAAASLPAGR